MLPSRNSLLAVNMWKIIKNDGQDIRRRGGAPPSYVRGKRVDFLVPMVRGELIIFYACSQSMPSIDIPSAKLT